MIDRVKGDRQAILLVGEREVERVVPLERLPAGSGPGTWLQVQFDGDMLIQAVIDEEETERVKARVQDKLEALRRRGLKGM